MSRRDWVTDSDVRVLAEVISALASNPEEKITYRTIAGELRAGGFPRYRIGDVSDLLHVGKRNFRRLYQEAKAHGDEVGMEVFQIRLKHNWSRAQATVNKLDLEATRQHLRRYAEELITEINDNYSMFMWGENQATKNLGRASAIQLEVALGQVRSVHNGTAPEGKAMEIKSRGAGMTRELYLEYALV